MNKPFVHLHLHTKYSLLDGACHVDQLVLRAKELGMDAVAITDHGVMHGAVDFYKTCRAHGIKPIIGCEAYINARAPRTDRNRETLAHHLVLLAANNEGYHNLMRLNTLAHLEGFYYKPRIDKEILRKYAGGLICLSACLKGEVNYNLKEGNFEAAESAALEYADIFGRDNFFLEMQDHGMEEQRMVNQGIRELCARTGLRAVVTNDVHYLHQNHAEAHEIMLCIQTNTTMSDPKRMRYSSNEFYFKSREELEKRFPGEPEPFDLTQEIAERCHVEMVFSDGTAKNLHFPTFTLPEDWRGSRLDYLVHLGKEGLRRHYGMDYDNPRSERERQIVERFNFEVGIIEKTGFVSYFLVVMDFIKWSRANGVPVGPGRGSGAGSLLAYSLDITQLDPLRFDLIFERFLNPERVSPPDFDVDFCQANRERTIEYVMRKYGKENVAQIVTFGALGAKTVIRDIARVLEIPLSRALAFSDLIPESPGMTLEKAKNANPEFKMLSGTDPDLRRIMQHAEVLEGFYRNTGVHPAGVVIGDKPLIDLVPLGRDKDGNPVTQYDKNPVEQVGLLKMDLLGLKTLTVIKEALDLVKLTQGVELDLHSPEFCRFDDAETFRLFQCADTVGVFQFESSGMRRVLTELKPNCIEDIVAATALFRPGPMSNIPIYAARKHGREKVVYDHPKLEATLKETHGIFVYQEQVQRASQMLAGYSLGRADLLRRAMGKKEPEVMARERPPFIKGCQEHSGIGPELANRIFDTMAQFAEYGFNKSHAAAYAVLSYQTAYLKAHYPSEFICAQISSEIGNFDKLPGFVVEATAMGLTILPPDVNRSIDRFMPEEGNVRFGLAGVKNVGEGAAQAIVAERRANGEFSGPLDLCKRLDPGLMNKRVLEALAKCGAMDCFGMDRARIFNSIDFCLRRAADALAEEASGQGNLFEALGVGESDTFAADTLPECAPWSEQERLLYERELLGIYLSGHPLQPFRRVIDAAQTCTISGTAEQPDNVDVRLTGMARSVNRRIHKQSKEPWAIINLDDGEASIEALIFPESYAKFHGACAVDRPLLVCGTLSRRDEKPKIIVNELFPLEEAARGFCVKVIVAMQANEQAGQSLAELRKIVAANPGATPLFICMMHGGGKRVVIETGADNHVDPSMAFVAAAEEAFGAKNLRLVMKKDIYREFVPKPRFYRSGAQN